MSTYICMKMVEFKDGTWCHRNRKKTLELQASLNGSNVSSFLGPTQLSIAFHFLFACGESLGMKLSQMITCWNRQSLVISLYMPYTRPSSLAFSLCSLEISMGTILPHYSFKQQKFGRRTGYNGLHISSNISTT